MSVQAMSWALQIAKADLSDSSARHVLLCLANYASADGRGTFPSANRLSEDTGLSERTFDTSWTFCVRLAGSLGAIRHSQPSISISMTVALLCMTFSCRGVQILHPVQSGVQLTHRGATYNRTGCRIRQNGVQNLHPNHHLTIK